MTEQTIEKAETIGGKSVVRPLTGTNMERGQPRIMTSSRFVNAVRKSEFSTLPKALCTYQAMYENNEAISTSIDTTNRFVVKALYNGKWVAPTGSNAGKLAADFLNYNCRNLSYGTWLEFIKSSCSDLINGFSIANIVTEVRNYGEYSGMRCLNKLSPRNQRTIYGWLWNKNFTELKGVVQKPNVRQNKNPTTRDFIGNVNFNDLTSLNLRRQQYPVIQSYQMLHFRHDPLDNNPEGQSPLVKCFDAHCHKTLLEEHSVIGISKDFAGMLVVRVPSELIERANNPTDYPNEAIEYQNLQTDAANLQNGKSSFILLSSDTDPTTRTPDYDIQFKGIDGGGKNYEVTKLLDHFNKSVYNTFNTGFLLLGQGASGSYALSSNQKDMHSFFVQDIITEKVDVLNNQLAPRLLMANDIQLSYKDMPVFVPADPDEASLDEVGKFIQRAASVGKLTKEATEYWYSKTGTPTEGIDDLEFTSDTTSRAGEGFGTSGNGLDNQQNSETNLDNKALKKFIVDGDRIINTETDKVVNFDQLDENGDYKE